MQGTACLDQNALQLTLQEAADSGQRLRYRLTMFTTVVGAVLVFLVLVVGQLVANRTLDQNSWGQPGYYSGMIAPFGSLMLLGIMPNDVLTIRVI